MPLVVLPAQPSDVKSMHDVYFAAFKDEPVMKFLFPGGVDRASYDIMVRDSWAHDTSICPVKCVDTSTGDIIGMATWEIYWRPGEGNKWKKPAGVTWLSGEEREKAEKVIMPMYNMRDELFGGRRHVYLATMAVHPDHQRRGVGRLLLQWGIDVAEKLELPIYLEATESGLPLYSHRDFERLEHVKVIHKVEATGAGEVEVPLMVKLPSKAKGIRFGEWAKKGYPETY
ncbi:hypothetical protein AAE478_005214 [Parahypoxylon ruwenzoriense]